jgi:Lon protease-like protein
MLEQPSQGFPLFPLGIVALPGESVPLHIFEDRYRKMIDHCLQSEEGEFGILWLSEEELKRVGCACEIERVLERLEDGRMNIVVRGVRPLRLIERQEDLPYPAEVADPEIARAARELYKELVMQATDRELDRHELAELDSYAMAATVEFEIQAKQELLELRSENARLRLLCRLLGEAIERLDLVERAQVRALSNGKVRFG